MDMSGYRPELSHVAQQSRRDKLRFLQASNPSHPLDSNLPNHPINPDVIHVRNVRNANLLYDPTMFSSEMLNFSINANNACHDEDLVASGETTQSNFGNWRSLNQPQNLDWSNNYATSNHHNQMFGREENNNNAFFPSSQKLHLGSSTMHFPSSPHHPPLNYVNALQDVVTLASTGSSSSSQDQLEMTSLVHQRIMENELVLLPSYASQSNNALRFDNGGNYNSWMENRSNWSSSAGGGGRHGDPNQQGLSLSLSSNPPSNKNPGSQYDVDQGFKDVQNSKIKPSMISKQPCEKPLQDIVGVMTTCGNSSRSTGPLGPFTGYATILKSSKFLKPAQQLLDEFCRTSDSKLKTYEASDERMSGEASASASASASVSVSHDAVNAIDTKMRTKGNNSGGSSSTFYGSNEISSDGCGAASISTESIRPEFQQKKAKLLYMQEEVCRRYKQYHQQMQMVVSSFETVAGLSSSTPYISMALNTVSRHFRCLTNSIKDQLRHIRKALGEEYLSSTVGTTSTRSGCSNKGDKNLGKLKHMGVGFQSHNYNKTSGGGSHVGFPEPQQHVWRPQRGLPERSVAILRAWLFEHFLHPYPTDTDKHMLATQTGLSRNQVSNWFINARVRVWKPMVEEIHMLETREGGQEQNPIPTNKDANCATDQATTSRTHSHNNDHQLLECSGDVEQSHHEMKRSRVECSRVPSSMDPGLMGFVPYQRGRLEVGGLGAVSLTLGLRHGVETAQQQQQQQHEDQLRRQLGGQMIRDFAG